MRPPFHQTISLRLPGLVSVIALMTSARAEILNYIPGTSSYYWGTPATWVEATIPNGPGAVVDLSADYTGTGVTIGFKDSAAASGTAVRTVGSLTIGDTGVAGSTTDGTIISTSFGNLIFDNNGLGAVFNTPTSQFTQSTGVPTFAAVRPGALQLNDNLTINNNYGPAAGTYAATQSSMSISGISELSGPRSVIFQSTAGTGTTALSSSSYTGGSSVLSGRVTMAAGDALGTGAVTVSNNAQVQLTTGDTTVANSFVLNGNGWAEAAGTRGALSIGANSTTAARTQTFTGGISIASASRIEAWTNVTANLNGPLSGAAPLEIKGGTVRLNGSGTGYTGVITLAAGRFDLNNTLGGSLVAQGLATSVGGKGTVSGNLELAAAAGPPLGTTLLVDAAAPGNLHTSGNLTLSGTTTVKLTSAPAATTTVLSYGGTLSGAANLALEGGIANYRAGTAFDTSTPGQVKLNFVSGSVTWNGAGGGNWQNFGTGWVGGDTFRPFDSVRFDNTVVPGTVNITSAVNARTITVDTATGTGYTLQATGVANGITAGSLVKSGAGTLTMGSTTLTTDNAHTFSGGVTLNDGTLRLNRGGDTTNANGPLGTGTTTLAGGALTSVGTGARILYNPVVFNGSFALGAAVTDTGNLTFNGGVNVAGASTVSVPLTTAIVAVGTSTTTGLPLSGSAALTKTGAGTLRVNAHSTYTGAISVDAGTFSIGSGTVFTVGSGGSLKTNGGTVAGVATTSSLVIAPGGSLSGTGTVGANTMVHGSHSPGFSPGLQTFSGGLTYSPSSSLTWELDSNAATVRGTNFDAVDVTGGTFDLQAGADIVITLTGSANLADSFWASAQSWLVVDLGSATTGTGGTGTFDIASVTGGGYSPALGAFSISRVADANGKNDVMLNWTPVPEPSTGLLALLGAGFLARRRRTRA